MNKHVIMLQVSQVNWKIVAVKGHTLVEDITVNSPKQAEEYVKNYISSFFNWTYEVIPLGGTWNTH